MKNEREAAEVEAMRRWHEQLGLKPQRKLHVRKTEPRSWSGGRKHSQTRRANVLAHWQNRRAMIADRQKACLVALWNHIGAVQITTEPPQEAWHWYRLPSTHRRDARWTEPFSAPDCYAAMYRYYQMHPTSNHTHTRLFVWRNGTPEMPDSGPWQPAVHVPAAAPYGGCHGAPLVVTTSYGMELRPPEPKNLLPASALDPIFKRPRGQDRVPLEWAEWLSPAETG
jgi:hypothetical protein